MRSELRFYAELKDFLAPGRRSGTIDHTFRVPGSVKDVIESYGVPHTEVDVILANGDSVDFSYQVRDGDRISVYPVFETFEVSPLVRVRPRPLRHVRFVLDGHLGKLARRLRLLGFDSRYDNDPSDDDLVDISTIERRILLTRDLALLKRRAVTHGYFVRSTAPREQVGEIVRRFQLGDRIEPYTRCLACNGLLEHVAKDEIAHRLPPKTRELYGRFRMCTACQKVYWRGAHQGRLDLIIAEARGAVAPPRERRPRHQRMPSMRTASCTPRLATGSRR
jgi:uncharacterized protein with PIN domain